MIYGLCKLSCIPIRKEASDASEMVSQLLFGDYFLVLSEANQWLKIQCLHDHYEGYIDRKQALLDISATEALKAKNNPLLLARASEIMTGMGSQLLSIGSSLPLMNAQLFPAEIPKPSAVIVKDCAQISESIAYLAQQFLGTPYLWGGRSSFGIDCSGFTQLVFKMKSIALPRDAYQQAEIGSTLSFLEEAKEGDLAFFDNQEGKIIHVGILLNSHEIIHASGQVRIDKIDHQGIFNQEIGKYTHQLRLLKRVR